MNRNLNKEIAVAECQNFDALSTAETPSCQEKAQIAKGDLHKEARTGRTQSSGSNTKSMVQLDEEAKQIASLKEYDIFGIEKIDTLKQMRTADEELDQYYYELYE